MTADRKILRLLPGDRFPWSGWVNAVADVLMDIRAAVTVAVDAPETEQPANAVPVRLADTLRGHKVGALRLLHGEAADAADHVRIRLAQYPADTPASKVYADWFGAR